MRSRILIVLLPCLLPNEAALAQAAVDIHASDVKGVTEVARLHRIQLDSKATQILSPLNDDHMSALNRKIANGADWQKGSLSIGPIRFDIGSSDRRSDGREAHFAHMHLDGVHLMGGEVSGTFDGRAATIRLSWPTGN